MVLAVLVLTDVVNVVCGPWLTTMTFEALTPPDVAVMVYAPWSAAVKYAVALPFMSVRAYSGDMVAKGELVENSTESPEVGNPDILTTAVTMSGTDALVGLAAS